MSNKIVLVLTEEELEELKTDLIIADNIRACKGYFQSKTSCILEEKLNKSKDKSFNFLYELAEIERNDKATHPDPVLESVFDLINNFIQGE
jgi:hypothetical protein